MSVENKVRKDASVTYDAISDARGRDRHVFELQLPRLQRRIETKGGTLVVGLPSLFMMHIEYNVETCCSKIIGCDTERSQTPEQVEFSATSELVVAREREPEQYSVREKQSQ